MRTADASSGRFPRGVVWGGAALIAGAVLFTSGYALASHHTSGSMERNTVIEAKGAQVMPFDQNKTTHIFQRPVPAVSNWSLPRTRRISSRSA